MNDAEALDVPLRIWRADPPAPTPEPTPGRLVLRSGRRTFYVYPRDIDWIESAGNYARVHAHGAGFLVRESIASLESRLGPTPLVRIHRSNIVNVDRVLEIRRHVRRRLLEVVLIDGTKLPLGGTYREALEKRLI